MATNAFERIRGEIASTQKQRHQIYVLKISFVTALLGFGAIRVQEITTYYPVLYLVPLVAVFFDFLIMGEHVSVRRMGTFLCLYSNEQEEREYENFAAENRDKFITIGLVGFTLLSWVAAFFFLHLAKRRGGSSVSQEEAVWFVGILFAFVAAVYFANQKLNDLDRQKGSTGAEQATRVDSCKDS